MSYFYNGENCYLCIYLIFTIKIKPNFSLMKIVKATYIVILFITGLLAGVFFSSSVSAQDISGAWHGKLSLPTGSLTIVFHISQTEQGAYVTTLDSPDQGANGIKTQTTPIKDSHRTRRVNDIVWLGTSPNQTSSINSISTITGIAIKAAKK